MSFFSALGGVLNSIPVVGHVKGAVHYMTGDTEAGTAAMHSATRTAAVIGGGVVGAAAGPAGAVAGAIGAGAAVDGIVTGYDSVISDEYRPHGQIETWTNVFTGKDIASNLADAAITTTLDGLGGYGASGIGKSMAREGGKAAMKTTGRQAAKQIMKNEVKSVALNGAVLINTFRQQNKEIRRLERVELERRLKESKLITTRKRQQQQRQREEEERKEKQQKRQKREEQNSNNHNENNQSSSGDTTADGSGYGNSSDEQSDSDTETDLDDISSTDDSSEDCSDEESSCQAEKSDKTKCKKEATQNGACARWKHQRDVLRSKGRIPPLPRYTPFQIPSLDDVKAENCSSIQGKINSKLQNGSYGDPGYIYLFELKGHAIKIGRTHRLPRKRMDEQYKDFVKIGKKSWRCPSVKLAEYLIHKFLDYCRLLDEETHRQVELFEVDMERAIRVIEEIIEAIKKSMKKGNDEDSGSA